MSRVLLAVAIDDWDLGPLAAKEAAAMRLEPLGHVQVLRVDEQAPEQMRMGAEPSEEAGRCPSRPVSGQAQTSSAHDSRKPRNSRATEMICCLNCNLYREQPGTDKAGAFFYGICRRTDRPVYSLMAQCGAWVRKEGRS